MRSLKLILSMMMTVSLIACSSDDNDETTQDLTSVSGALDVARQKIASIVPDTSSVTESAIVAQGSMSVWTAGSSQYSLGGDFGESPRNYVRNLGDESKQSMLMMRLNQVMQNLCIFGVALPSTDGAPDLASETTVTLTAELKAEIASSCDVDAQNLPPDGTQVGYDVVDISGETDSQYERRVRFDMAGGTDWTNYFYYTLSENLTRISYVEDSSNDSVALFEYNPSEQLFKFEFSEFIVGDESSDYRIHYRGILEEETGLGRFTAAIQNRDDDDLSEAVVSIREGQGSEIHVSYAFDDGADSDDFTDGSACINASTFAIATDDTETCSSGQITGVLVSSYTVSIGAVNSTDILNTDETAAINFTDLSDILNARNAGITAE